MEIALKAAGRLKLQKLTSHLRWNPSSVEFNVRSRTDLCEGMQSALQQITVDAQPVCLHIVPVLRLWGCLDAFTANESGKGMEEELKGKYLAQMQVTRAFWNGLDCFKGGDAEVAPGNFYQIPVILSEFAATTVAAGEKNRKIPTKGWASYDAGDSWWQCFLYFCYF